MESLSIIDVVVPALVVAVISYLVWLRQRKVVAQEAARTLERERIAALEGKIVNLEFQLSIISDLKTDIAGLKELVTELRIQLGPRGH